MLLVSTYLAQSTIHGLGLYAAKPIQKGEVVWRYDPLLDRTLRLDEILAAPSAVQEKLAMYAYEDPNQPAHYVWCGDDARYMNHSTIPNTEDTNAGAFSTAIMDIPVGVELTIDYGSFGADITLNDWQAEKRRYANLLRQFAKKA